MQSRRKVSVHRPKAAARRLMVWSVLVALPWAVQAATLPQHDGNKHMGPATCASPVCHGRTLEDPDANVLRNEYRTWAKYDRHARAYQTLLTDESRAIARKLGLKNAHQARICLDCHADNVPEQLRGARFHLDDGVGCEACHGGAEKWLLSHATRDATHQDNVRAGMYPTDNIEARAELCLSCHYGTREKFASHRIMGAGHPRISFELDTFTLREPEHYRVDSDYLARKGSESAVKRWATGMLVAARKSMEMLDSPLFLEHPVHPEIALFDCHACHQSMRDLNWVPRPSTAAIGPGMVRLNDSSLLIAIAIIQRVDPQAGKSLTKLVQQLHRASADTRQAVVKVSRVIRDQLHGVWDSVRQHEFADNDVRIMLSNITALGVKDEFRDYSGAEQAVMAVDVLTYATWPGDARIRRGVDGLYDLIANDDDYPADRLRKAMQDLRRAFNR